VLSLLLTAFCVTSPSARAQERALWYMTHTLGTALDTFILSSQTLSYLTQLGRSEISRVGRGERLAPSCFPLTYLNYYLETNFKRDLSLASTIVTLNFHVYFCVCTVLDIGAYMLQILVCIQKSYLCSLGGVGKAFLYATQHLDFENVSLSGSLSQIFCLPSFQKTVCI